MGGKLGTDIPVRCCFGYFVMYLFCSFPRCFRNLVEITASSSVYRGNNILQYTVFFIVHMCIIAGLPKLKCSKADKNAPRPQWNGGLGFLFACLFVFHIYTYIYIHIYTHTYIYTHTHIIFYIKYIHYIYIYVYIYIFFTFYCKNMPNNQL